MSNIPKLGTKDQLPGNIPPVQQTARNGLVTFYPFGTDQNQPAVISINGDNGGVDIGGTRDKDGKLLVRDKWMTITYVIDGETGTASQSGDIVLYDANGCERVRISGKTADVTLKNPVGDVVAHLDGKSGDLRLGGGGQDGSVILADAARNESILMDGGTGEVAVGGGRDGAVVVKTASGSESIRLAGQNADITVGGGGQAGDVVVKNTAGSESIRLAGQNANLTVGGGGQAGDVVVKNTAGNESIRLAGGTGDITVGGNGQDGDVVVKNTAGTETIRLTGGTGDITVGGNGQDGDVVVKNTAGNESIRLAGGTGDITAGGNGQAGDVVVKNATGSETIRLTGNTGDITVGGNGQNGDIRVKSGNGTTAIRLEASTGHITVGGAGINGDVIVNDSTGLERIRLDGDTGDIRLQGADCAEEFSVIGVDEIDPGTVLVIDDNAVLRPCTKAYDRKVAGVVSGASGTTPGIILGRQASGSHRLPIALNGKVFCKVDARSVPIKVGDLLTTSSVPGYAMKAEDSSRAFGAVIGKALCGIESGQGLVPILVSLQ